MRAWLGPWDKGLRPGPWALGQNLLVMSLSPGQCPARRARGTLARARRSGWKQCQWFSVDAQQCTTVGVHVICHKHKNTRFPRNNSKLTEFQEF